MHEEILLRCHLLPELLLPTSLVKDHQRLTPQVILTDRTQSSFQETEVATSDHKQCKNDASLKFSTTQANGKAELSGQIR